MTTTPEAARDAHRRVTVRCLFCEALNSVDLALLDQAQPRCGECHKPILLDRPVPVTDAEFERVIQDAEVPVVVDFYADWCGPCKVMAPIFDELAYERMGRVLVAKLDTDRNQATSMKYGIRGIPTLIVFKGGREVARQVGAVPKGALLGLLTKAD
jgi:thioredoxin 2